MLKIFPQKLLELHWFARAAVSKVPQTDCLNRNVLSHSFGGQKFKIKRSVDILLRPMEGNPFHVSLPVLGGLLTILRIPWLLMHHLDLCLHRHMVFFLCVCVCVCVCPNLLFL